MAIHHWIAFYEFQDRTSIGFAVARGDAKLRKMYLKVKSLHRPGDLVSDMRSKFQEVSNGYRNSCAEFCGAARRCF